MKPELFKLLWKLEQLVTDTTDDLGFHYRMANICVEDRNELRRILAEAGKTTYTN